jgi:hypothetical protein
MNFHDGESKLTVRSILFSLVLTQAGKQQFDFIAIQFHSYPTNLAYISRHRFTDHTMGSKFPLPVDRSLFSLSQTFYFAIILENVTTATSLCCWKQKITAARCHIRTASGRFHDLIKKLFSHRPYCGEGGVLCGIFYLGTYSDRLRGKRSIKRYVYLDTDFQVSEVYVRTCSKYSRDYC